jgi:hypothetical protein
MPFGEIKKMIILNNIADFNRAATKINTSIQFASADFQELTEQTVLSFSSKLQNQVAPLNTLLDIAYDSNTINTPAFIRYIQEVIPHKVGKAKGNGRRKQFFNKKASEEYKSEEDILIFIKNHPMFLNSLKTKEKKEKHWEQEKEDKIAFNALLKKLELFKEHGQDQHYLSLLQKVINENIVHSTPEFSHIVEDTVENNNQQQINSMMSDEELLAA